MGMNLLGKVRKKARLIIIDYIRGILRYGSKHHIVGGLKVFDKYSIVLLSVTA